MGFITFFPHMVAGPIQQATHFLVQFQRPREFNWDESVDGCRQMLWGYFKKMVVADTLARYVEMAYGNVGAATGSDLLWASYFFAFQIYCDFSGYTDIAIGCAKLFNFHMSRNFAYPYFSESIPEFWRRWHIALSDWFRRYLYIPLGGNRVSRWRWCLNVTIVFLVSGLWHGANWTFLIWGGLHGAFFIIYTLLAPPRSGKPGLQFQGGFWLRRSFNILITFHLVCFAWIFFRASALNDALLAIQKIGVALSSLQIHKPSPKGWEWIILLLVVEWLSRNRLHALAKFSFPVPVRWTVYYALVLAIIFATPLTYIPFIYFQF
jgi:D-alanyl-lipoteichoic acid acyltransferase DltB (MBOAT superfamily)